MSGQPNILGNAATPGVTGNSESLAGYTSMLGEHGFEWNSNEFFLIIGVIPEHCPWLIHVSIVYPELPEFLMKALSVMKTLGISFRIPKDSRTAQQLMSGKLGLPQFGKMITLFPLTEQHAVEAADVLISLSDGFKGPVIPHVPPLGGLVYAQYAGKVEFRPQLWPFHQPIPKPPSIQKVFLSRYKIIRTIKPDIKGDVYLGRYVKALFRVPKCIIKEGRRYMWTDAGRRDMSDRLRWQEQLQRELSNIVNVPQVIAFFTDNDNTYLVMEFIKGRSLEQVVKTIYNGQSWSVLNRKNKARLLDLLLGVVEIVQRLHQNGYIHRDLTPVNFLMEKSGRLVMIDLELAYSTKNGFPDPPFGNGTRGFMSPEQHDRQKPTVFEDIYGLGGMMTVFFTNLAPIEINKETCIADPEKLKVLIGNEDIANLISACYEQEPGHRPTVQKIKTVILKERANLERAILK